jgi:hypothetical protein
MVLSYWVIMRYAELLERALAGSGSMLNNRGLTPLSDRSFKCRARAGIESEPSHSALGENA